MRYMHCDLLAGDADAQQQTAVAAQVRSLQRSISSADTLLFHLLPNCVSALLATSSPHASFKFRVLNVLGIAMVQSCTLATAQAIIESKQAMGSWAAWLWAPRARKANLHLQKATPFWLTGSSSYDCRADPELRRFVCPIKKAVAVDPVITVDGQVSTGNCN